MASGWTGRLPCVCVSRVLCRASPPPLPQAGLEPVSLLRWSPCGSYLLAGRRAGGFRLWETSTWSSERWGDGPADALVDAVWGRDGRSLLLAQGARLSSLHLTADPPTLAAQVLPVALPELARGGGGDRGPIQAMAWDRRGQRLAVAVALPGGGGGGAAAGVVALYDTRSDPILSVRFVGFMRVRPMRGSPGGRNEEEEWEIVEAEEAEGGEAGPSAAAGAGEAAAKRGEQRVGLAFMASFGQGAVLAVRQGAFVGAVPMYFSS